MREFGLGGWRWMVRAREAAVVATLLLSPLVQARADGGAGDSSIVHVRTMEIDVWPEYDDPRVLVMYKGELDSSVAMPTRFSFVIPRGAQVHMAGSLTERGEHKHALFETLPTANEGVEVAYELTSRLFYMEFYYDPFTDGSDRHFSYPVRLPYETARLEVRVQQPLKAEGFRTTPTPVDVVSDANGFRYSRFVYDSLAAGSEQAVTVSYAKSDRIPSVSPPGSGSTGQRTAMRNLLIIIVVLLVGVVGYGILRGGRHHGGRRQRSTAAGASPMAGTAKYQFCPMCGSEMDGGHKFCHNCGTPAPRAASAYAGRATE